MATKKAEPVKKETTKAAPVQKEAPKKKEVKTSINAKMANPDQILKDYDKLIADLAKVESSQRNQKKPSRIYFVHRKRAEVMRQNFIKSMR